MLDDDDVSAFDWHETAPPIRWRSTLAVEDSGDEPGLECCCGLYVCVMFEMPGGWSNPPGGGWISGLGLRVGDIIIGDEFGVLASGDCGMLCHDWRRFTAALSPLCFKPFNELGRLNCEAGEFGAVDPAELLESDSLPGVGERFASGELHWLSPDDSERLNWTKERLGGAIGELSCSTLRLLRRRNSDEECRRRSSLPPRDLRPTSKRLTRYGAGTCFRRQTLMVVLASGATWIRTWCAWLKIRDTTWTCKRPWTAVPFTRNSTSPGWRPASKAGLPDSTDWNHKMFQLRRESITLYSKTISHDKISKAGSSCLYLSMQILFSRKK